MTRAAIRKRLRGILERADTRYEEGLRRLATSRAPRDERRRAHAQRGAAVSHARRARRRRNVDDEVNDVR